MSEKNLGSSETTREPPSHSFSFENFYNFQGKKGINESFLQWFIGFSEGDGSFVSRKDGGRLRWSFEISQKNPRTLKRIRTQLGFGRVRPCGEYFKYQVTDIAGLQRIIAIFHGNLVLPKRRVQFERWLSEMTFQFHHISFQCREVLPSLETGWLAGFLDAEGCFYANFTTPSNRSNLSARLTQRVTLTQQDLAGDVEILFYIGKLLFVPETTESENRKHFNVSLAKKPNVYRLDIASSKSQGILIAYLRLFPLVEKAVPFARWLRVYNQRVQGLHLTERGIRRIQRLCKRINGDSFFTKKEGRVIIS